MPVATKRRIVRQKAKGPIDPIVGQRVRALRLARGLSQAELAGSDFTKGFISLVETGRTRMSLRAAEIIAGRLSSSVGELLESASGSARQTELLLVRADAEIRAGRIDEARELTKALERHTTGLAKARLLHLRGRILIEERHPREAIRLLDEALRTFRGVGATEGVVRVLFDLARAHSRLEERGEALNLALEVERSLLTGVLVDRTLELQVLCFIAATYVTLGDYGSADIRTQRARELAEDVTDERAVAALYESLAVTRQEQGDYEAALAFARRALAAYESLGLRAMVGSAWNTIGWVYVQRKQFARAAEALAKADRVAEDSDDGRLRGYVLQTKAELELARGHPREAIGLAEASASVAAASERGRALSLLVKARALGGTKASLSTVNAAFEAAFEALKPFGQRQLARAYEAQFELLSARGHFREAAASAQRALNFLHPSLGSE